MKRIKQQLEELRALIPQQPELLVATWNPDSGAPKPEAPPGYQGIFVIVRSYIVETGEYVDVDRVAEERTVTTTPPQPEQPPVPQPRRNGLIYR